MHLGHFVGSLANRVKLQDEYDQYILIADVQALTDSYENPTKVADSVRDLVLDYIAAGIDPSKSTIVLQSQVPAIAELTIFYLNMVSLNRVLRNPTVKAEIEQKGFGDSVPAGFAMYPVSQAADITAFEANLVPVGEDQLPMIEQTREIVRKFNGLYGQTLVEPDSLISEFPRLVGLDGKAKMSKSLNNCIFLSDDEATVTKKVMGMYTDPSRIHPTDPGVVEGNPLFIYHDIFNPNKDQVADFKERYQKGTVGDVEIKRALAKVINELLDPIRKKREAYAKDEDYLDEILRKGQEKTVKVASEVLVKVKQAMKIEYGHN